MAAAGNSMFAVTCGLLRQYMREHQQQPPPQQTGAFRLPPLPEATEEDEETDTRTMQLFPTCALQPSQQQPMTQAKAPLTIFYEGRVLVFDDFPADKAMELMQIAGSGSSPAPKNGASAVPEKPAAKKPSAVPSDMPVARKASLQRFLQKRRHRISANNPYHLDTVSSAPENNMAAGKPVKEEPSASWFAL